MSAPVYVPISLPLALFVITNVLRQERGSSMKLRTTHPRKGGVVSEAGKRKIIVKSMLEQGVESEKIIRVRRYA